MKLNRQLLVLIIAIAAMIFNVSCGDDDDDSNDDGQDVADDDADDDVDDDVNDDIDDDTDDDIDDDTDDDVDYTKEPLAVLECEVKFADVDGQIQFTGENSIDPLAGTLSYSYDFGDGETADTANAQHSFDEAGAYRIRLSVENEAGFTDHSSHTVFIGDLPTAQTGLDSIDFRSVYYDASILEDSQKPEGGGHFWGFFIAADDATPDTLIINGEVYDMENPPANLQWCEFVPEILEAGDVGIVRCHSSHPDFNAGETVSIEVKDGETTLWTKTAQLLEPVLTPSFITANREDDEIYVHVRNDSEHTINVTGLSLNGVDISNFIDIMNPELRPTETAMIRVPQPDGVTYHQWTVFTVHGSDGRAVYESSRGMRLFAPKFFIGDWNGGSAWDDMEAQLLPLIEVGVDTFKWDGQYPEAVFQFIEDNDVYVWSHHGDLADHPERAALIEAWGDQPRWIGNAVKGEGDDEDPNIPLKKLKDHRELWPHQRLWIYNHMSYRFHTWGGMADFSGMDHYCVWAAQSNFNWPPFYWDEIDNAGIYADIIKRMAEPTPIWNWTQSMWNTFDLDGNQFRCTTADEFRSQWYQMVAYGAKSIFYFVMRTEWLVECDDPMGEQEHVNVADEIHFFEDVILEGDSTLKSQSRAVANDDLIDVNTVTSPRGMIVILTNLDYDLNLIMPYHWYEKTNVVVDVAPPEGFEPGTFQLVHGQTQTDLQWSKTGPNTWRFTLPSLPVAEAVLIRPEP